MRLKHNRGVAKAVQVPDWPSLWAFSRRLVTRFGLDYGELTFEKPSGQIATSPTTLLVTLGCLSQVLRG